MLVLFPSGQVKAKVKISNRNHKGLYLHTVLPNIQHRKHPYTRWNLKGKNIRGMECKALYEYKIQFAGQNNKPIPYRGNVVLNTYNRIDKVY